MNGDHAATEKRIAQLLGEMKREETLPDFGEKQIEGFTLTTLLSHVVAAKEQQINNIGGMDIVKTNVSDEHRSEGWR